MTTCNGTALGPSRDQHFWNAFLKGDLKLDDAAINNLVAQICLPMVPCITDVYQELFKEECDLFVINRLQVNQELVLSDIATIMLAERLCPKLKTCIIENIMEIKTLQDITLLNPNIVNATLDSDTMLQIYNFLISEPQINGIVSAICTKAKDCILNGINNKL